MNFALDNAQGSMNDAARVYYRIPYLLLLADLRARSFHPEKERNCDDQHTVPEGVSYYRSRSIRPYRDGPVLKQECATPFNLRVQFRSLFIPIHLIATARVREIPLLHDSFVDVSAIVSA
ncbi:hypothetical protein JVT61DRAFT_14473 [Boletus reticuloceps]|uniref:Uncharacterized protein n=1 Tax=Boletus reticuloceps TaxID=495285 RepID=A0A8I3ABT7_9AGAM|nr:hypothetical protein JVT61DRAFT_14473 [Boletus reticuloceps]